MKDAGEYYKVSNKGHRKIYPLVPETNKDTGYPLKLILLKNQTVLLLREYEEEPQLDNKEWLNERMYIIKGIDEDGVKLYYNKEARMTTEVIKHMNDVINKFNKENNIIDKKGNIKESKLTSPKGGDVIGKYKEFPYIKFKPNGFNALVEGIDFEITTTGEIKQLK